MIASTDVHSSESVSREERHEKEKEWGRLTRLRQDFQVRDGNLTRGAATREQEREVQDVGSRRRREADAASVPFP